MTCVHSQGSMKRGTAPIHIDRAGCHITIDSVPAWTCEQCGEPLFVEQEVEAIQEIARAVDEKCRLLQRSAWNLAGGGRFADSQGLSVAAPAGPEV